MCRPKGSYFLTQLNELTKRDRRTNSPSRDRRTISPNRDRRTLSPKAEMRDSQTYDRVYSYVKKAIYSMNLPKGEFKALSREYTNGIMAQECSLDKLSHDALKFRVQKYIESTHADGNPRSLR